MASSSSDKIIAKTSEESNPRSKVCDKTCHKSETYEKALEAVRSYEIEHTVRFVARTSNKNFGKTDLFQRTHHVSWSDDFLPSKVPYVILNRKQFDCQHGPDQNVAKKKKKISEKESKDLDHGDKAGKMIRQRTKKFNCPAKVVMHEIMEFPDFKITKDMSAHYRQIVSEALKNTIRDKGNLGTYNRKFVTKIDDIASHENHPVVKHNAIVDSNKNIEISQQPHDVSDRAHSTSLSASSDCDDAKTDVSKQETLLKNCQDAWTDIGVMMNLAKDSPDILDKLFEDLSVVREKLKDHLSANISVAGQQNDHCYQCNQTSPSSRVRKRKKWKR